MKKIYEYVYRHGATHWVRVRIPKDLKWAYPEGQDELLDNLHTGDPAEAKVRGYAVIARTQAEFQEKRGQRDLSQASLSPKRIEKLTDKELTLVGGFYQRSVLQQDQTRRQAGLDDDEFEELGRELTDQHADLSRLLAQGKSQPILGVLHSVLHLCGIDFQPNPEAARQAGFAFLRSVVDTLDKQLQRQAGGIVDTDAVAPPVAHPLKVIAPECAPIESLGPSWDKVFELWCQHGEGRPIAEVHHRGLSDPLEGAAALCRLTEGPAPASRHRDDDVAIRAAHARQRACDRNDQRAAAQNPLHLQGRQGQS